MKLVIISKSKKINNSSKLELNNKKRGERKQNM